MTDAAESLRHAAAVVPLVSPDRIRIARDHSGWTQLQLAEVVGLTPAAISQLEAGRSRPSAQTLVALADATGYPIDYFARHQGDAEFTGFFRSLRSSPVRERRRALAWAHLLNDLAGALASHVRLPQLDVPRHVVDAETSREEIEQIADGVRETWGLGWGPIDDVVRQLEIHGVIVAALPLHRLDLDAFSAWFSERPVAVLGRDKQVTARSRFDAAHELGHLVMHEPQHAGTKIAETQAHQFAAAFLMPARSIAHRLPVQADWRLLMRLKLEWRVSLQALLMRAKTVGPMTDARYVSAMKQVSARGWRKAEPGDAQLGEPEFPRLIELALAALDRQGFSLEDLAQEAGLPIAHLHEILSVSLDQRPTLDL